jgi:hypothetical protein
MPEHLSIVPLMVFIYQYSNSRQVTVESGVRHPFSEEFGQNCFYFGERN